MRCISSSCKSIVPLAISALMLAGALEGAAAQETTEKAPATATATATDSTAAPEAKSNQRVRISIDESGISIEGNAQTEGEWVEIRDDRGPYREKGVDIVKFGKSVFVAKDEMVRGDLVVFGANAIIEGRVTGDVFVVGGNIRLRSGAEIKGDAMIIGGVLDADEDVVIHGERILFDDVMPELGIGGVFGHETWLRWVLLPVMFFVQLVLAFLVMLFMRERVVVGHDHLSANFLKSFGAGILTAVLGSFALLIVMVPLVITVIGIPLAVLLVISCWGVFMIAWTVFAFSLGRLISERTGSGAGNSFLSVFIGTVVLFLPLAVSFILSAVHTPPLSQAGMGIGVFGILVGAFAYLAGLGALVVSRFGSRPLLVPPLSTPPPTAGSEAASLSG